MINVISVLAQLWGKDRFGVQVWKHAQGKEVVRVTIQWLCSCEISAGAV